MTEPSFVESKSTFGRIDSSELIDLRSNLMNGKLSQSLDSMVFAREFNKLVHQHISARDVKAVGDSSRSAERLLKELDVMSKFPPLRLALDKLIGVTANGSQLVEITYDDVSEVIQSLKQNGVRVDVFSQLSRGATSRGLTKTNPATIRQVPSGLLRQPSWVLNVLTAHDQIMPRNVLGGLTHDMIALMLEVGFDRDGRSPAVDKSYEARYPRQTSQFEAYLVVADGLMNTIDRLRVLSQQV